MRLRLSESREGCALARNTNFEPVGRAGLEPAVFTTRVPGLQPGRFAACIPTQVSNDPGRSRTCTERILNPPPLPVGLRGLAVLSAP